MFFILYVFVRIHFVYTPKNVNESQTKQTGKMDSEVILIKLHPFYEKCFIFNHDKKPLFFVSSLYLSVFPFPFCFSLRAELKKEKELRNSKLSLLSDTQKD